MENMILLDIETLDFGVESGIYEVALMIIEDGEVILTEHIAEAEDETLIDLGMGEGYKDISKDELKKKQFQNIINTYNYPLVAHNIPFDRKFLVHYGWLDEDYECYDSIRAIKYENPDLFSYSLDYLLSFYNIERPLTHIALDDVKALYEIIMAVKPKLWVPLYKVNPSELNKFMDTVINIEGESTVFKSKRIVFTGASPFPRVLMKEIASKCGATVTGNVSKKTDLLICGEKPGGKLDKARELETEIQTDEWFIDAVSKDLNLDTVSITRKPKDTNNDGQESSFTKILELENKSVNIALLPIKTQEKVEDILMNYMDVSKVNKSSNGYKVDFIIHSNRREYELVRKAKELGVETIPLHKFNQMILSKPNKNE